MRCAVGATADVGSGSQSEIWRDRSWPEPGLTIVMYCGQFNDRIAPADWTLAIGLSERPAFNAIDACP